MRSGQTQDDIERASRLGGVIRSHLLDGVLPFWADHAVNADGSGFWPHLARDGARLGDGAACVVAIARLTYAFATAAEITGDDRFQRFAQTGALQLMRYYNAAEQSWVWRVGQGGQVLDPTIRPYGAVFAIYALATAGRVCGRSEFIELAVRSAEALWERAREPRLGAFWQELSPSWNPSALFHRLDTHLHAMEACCALWAATADGVWKQRWRELALYIGARAFDCRFGCVCEALLPDGQEALEQTRGLVNYGHNLEAAWFLTVAAQELEEPGLAEVGSRLLEFAFAEGSELGPVPGAVPLEHSNGNPAPAGQGCFRSFGTPGKPVPDNGSSEFYTWWVQAEGLGALSASYRVRPERRLLVRLEQLWQRTISLFHDTAYGGWFAEVTPDGRVPDTTKGGDWKAAYHVMQACVHAASALDGHLPPGQRL